MIDKRIKFLSNIPETEAAQEDIQRKWVPKKKHEVLKAKYKCLKKLFQIYDAGILGMLPPTEAEPDNSSLEPTRRKIKRSHRPKTDTAAGTSETDLTFDPDETYQESDTEKNGSLNHEPLNTVQSKPTSTISTQVEENLANKSKISFSSKHQDEGTKDSQLNLLLTPKSNMGCECSQTIQTSKSEYYGNRRTSRFKFQAFLRRLFGVRPDARQSNGKSHTASYCARRKRGPIRIKGQSRSRNISDSCLRDAKNPAILSYVQSVQKHCLNDNTPRRCPVIGCEMTTNGIINYNDHLNISHFTGKKYVCHYCHEGFEQEQDKVDHENEHIGINKLGKKIAATNSFMTQVKTTSVTQTEPQIRNANLSDDKLNKIIHFFEKIPDPERFVADVKNQSYPNMDSRGADHHYDDLDTVDGKKSSSKSSGRKVSSCGDFKGRNYLNELSTIVKRTTKMANRYQKSNGTCDSIDEQLDKRYLRNTKNNSRSMYTKTHHSPTVTSASTRPNIRPSAMTSKGKKTQHITSNDGAISIKESYRTLETKSDSFKGSFNDLSQESDAEVLYDEQSNIIYFTSLEAPTSTNNRVVNKIGAHACYKWEPGKKDIPV